MVDEIPESGSEMEFVPSDSEAEDSDREADSEGYC